MSDLNLPFEPCPRTELPAEGAMLSGGVVVMAVTIAGAGGRPSPALMFRFAKADGSGFYPPTVLCPDEHNALARLGALVSDAATRAIAVAVTGGDS